MTLSAAYWILVLLWVILGAWRGSVSTADRIGLWGGTLILTLILLVIGLSVFGGPIQGR